MLNNIKILFIEDLPTDVALAKRTLSKEGIIFQSRTVEREDDFLRELKEFVPDIIISDYRMPEFDGMSALRLTLDHYPDIPFILATAAINEETAVECMKAGATDYIIKEHITRLPFAVKEAIKKKEAQIEIKQNEEKYRSLFENMLEGVAYCKMLYDDNFQPVDFIYLNVNHAFEQLTALKNVIGKPVSEVIPGTKELYPELFECYNRVASTGKPEKFKQYFKSLNQWLFISVYRPAPGYFVAVFNDITEHKRAEEVLRDTNDKLIQAQRVAHIGSWETDLMNLYVHWSNETYKIFELEPASFKSSHPDFMTFIHPEDREKVDAAFKASIGKHAENSIEHRIVTGGGNIKYIEEHWQIIHDNQGLPVRAVGTCQDITDRKRSEDKLKESEREFHLLAESMPQIVWITDPNGLNIYFNQQWTDYTGMTLEESYGDGWSKPFHPDDQKMAWESWENATNNLATYSIECRLRRADGDYKWWLIRGVPVKDNNGNIIKWFGTCTDINDIKTTEERLKESSDRLRDIVSNVGDWVWELNEYGVYIYSSPSGADLLGRSLDEIIGKTPFDFMDPDEAKIVEKIYSEILAVKGYIKDLENWNIKKNGERICLLTNGVPVLDKEGNLKGYRGVGKDITSRKHAETELLKLSMAVRQSQDSIIITDTKGTIEYANPKATIVSGYSNEEIIGKNPRIFSSHEKSNNDYQILWETILSGKVWSGEFHNKMKNGELYWEHATISPIINEKGEITHFLAVKEDVTDKKILLNQLLQSQKVESIGTLASGIAHDFNNVLGIILAYLGVLEYQQKDTQMFSESLNVIKKAVERGAHLVSQILTFARKTDTTIRPMSLKDLINEISIMIQQTFPKIIEVKVLLENNLPYLSADKTKIHQVILNLCVNARDAMPKGGILTISANKISDNQLPKKYSKGKHQHYIALSVADNGIGMDQRTMQQIFDPFFTTKSVDKGTGLGLSVVYGIAELHNGYIDVQSEVGKGSTFTLYLPLIENVEKIILKDEKTKGELRGGTETILVVEDEESLISMIKIVLETNGYTVLEARNGEEGVHIYENNMEKIHMVLTDMGLPKLTGFEEFKKIKKLDPDVKVVFASGYFDPNLKSELFKDGVKAFIQKPYDANEILRTIREVLDQN
jgi:PAS domain S-box-containing protein